MELLNREVQMIEFQQAQMIGFQQIQSIEAHMKEGSDGSRQYPNSSAVELVRIIFEDLSLHLKIVIPTCRA